MFKRFFPHGAPNTALDAAASVIAGVAKDC